jgi:hypothetical protein
MRYTSFSDPFKTWLPTHPETESLEGQEFTFFVSRQAVSLCVPPGRSEVMSDQRSEQSADARQPAAELLPAVYVDRLGTVHACHC